MLPNFDRTAQMPRALQRMLAPGQADVAANAVAPQLS